MKRTANNRNQKGEKEEQTNTAKRGLYRKREPQQEGVNDMPHHLFQCRWHYNTTPSYAYLCGEAKGERQSDAAVERSPAECRAIRVVVRARER